MAQETPSQEAQAAPAANASTPWGRVCVDENDDSTCRIVQTLFQVQVDDEGKQKPETRTFALGLTVVYAQPEGTDSRTPYMAVVAPLGVDLAAKSAIKVDSGARIDLDDYVRCTVEGCQAAAVPLDETLLQSMKRGKILFVAYRMHGADDSVTVQASLQGFTKAFSALK